MVTAKAWQVYPKLAGPHGLMLSWPGEVCLQETHTYQSTAEETLVIQMSAKQVFWFDLNNEEQKRYNVSNACGQFAKMCLISYTDQL